MAKRGRPFLPEEDRRTDSLCVRLNDRERRRLQRLSFLLDMARFADVVREGLLALEEREAQRAELAAGPEPKGPPRPGDPPVRKPR